MTEQEVDEASLPLDEPNNDPQREATELTEHENEYEHEPETSVRGRHSEAGQPTDRRSHLHQRGQVVKHFWTHQIALTVSHTDCRDHFALERTYLSYLRTSLAFAILGTTIAQLFRLQIQAQQQPQNLGGANSNSDNGLFALGIPLASIFIGAAMAIAILGAVSFWRQQNAMARGKVYAGGWEIKVVAGATLIVCMCKLK